MSVTMREPTSHSAPTTPRSLAWGLLAAVAGALLASCGGSNPNLTVSPEPSATPDTLPVAASVTLYAAGANDTASALAAGDFNGDGIADVALAAAFADGPDGARPDAGETYVFLGPFSHGETRDAGMGQQDSTIYGAQPGDQAGRSIAAADVNGDGITDIIIGAPFADGPGGSRTDAGEAYVVFGSRSLGQQAREVDLAAGAGLVFLGATAGDLAGFAVTAAHLNGDAYADIIVGAFWADGPSDARDMAGEVYAVFGGPSLPTTIDASAGQQDVTIYGAASGDRLGEGVAAGDINGDGLDDLVLPAPFAPSKTGVAAAGRTYVMLSPAPQSVDLAEGFPGPVVYGADDGDQLGHVVATGDVDGDGRDDLLLTAVSADGPGNTVDLAGEAVLVLAKSLLASAETDAAAGGGDTTIYGADVEDRLGRSAGIGDVDGDGLADLLLGAPGGDGPGEDTPQAGDLYLIPGGPLPKELQMPRGALTYSGRQANGQLASEVFGRLPLVAADIDGDGRDDILVSAPNAGGPGGRTSAGQAFILFAGPLN